MNRPHDTASGTDALAALRAATSERHERLDSGLPLSGAAPGLHDYAQHLILVRDWLAPLQAWLEGFGDGPQKALPAVERLALAAQAAGLLEMDSPSAEAFIALRLRPRGMAYGAYEVEVDQRAVLERAMPT